MDSSARDLRLSIWRASNARRAADESEGPCEARLARAPAPRLPSGPLFELALAEAPSVAAGLLNRLAPSDAEAAAVEPFLRVGPSVALAPLRRACWLPILSLLAGDARSEAALLAQVAPSVEQAQESLLLFERAKLASSPELHMEWARQAAELLSCDSAWFELLRWARLGSDEALSRLASARGKIAEASSASCRMAGSQLPSLVRRFCDMLHCNEARLGELWSRIESDALEDLDELPARSGGRAESL